VGLEAAFFVLVGLWICAGYCVGLRQHRARQERKASAASAAGMFNSSVDAHQSLLTKDADEYGASSYQPTII